MKFHRVAIAIMMFFSFGAGVGRLWQVGVDGPGDLAKGVALLLGLWLLVWGGIWSGADWLAEKMQEGATDGE